MPFNSSAQFWSGWRGRKLASPRGFAVSSSNTDRLRGIHKAVRSRTGAVIALLLIEL
jgi:hypothetical protein